MVKTQYISASSKESDDQDSKEFFWRSMSIMLVDFLASNSFIINARQVFTKFLLLKPDC